MERSNPISNAVYSVEVSLPIELETQVEDLSEWAKQYHTDEAEYHRFSHSQRVYEVSLWLADIFESQGHKINRRVLSFAAITHDLYAHLPISQSVPETSGHSFSSKEERTGNIVFNQLVKIGYDEEAVARPVYGLIMATKSGEPCDSPEAVILRMADIFNTVEAYDSFEDQAKAIYRETCKFENKDCTFAEWVPGAMNYLESFLDEPNIPEEFKLASRTNIAQLRSKYPVAS